MTTPPPTTTSPRPATADGQDLDHLAEDDRVAAVHALHVLDTPAEARFDRVTRLAQRLFGVEVALVTLLDRDRQWFKSRAGLDVQQIPRDQTVCTFAIRQADTTVIGDLTADQRFAASPLLAVESPFRFYASHPLQAPGGQRVGTLCLLDREPREFAAHERETLRDLAEYVEQELSRREESDRAAEVHRSLLPQRVLQVPGFELAGACLPARAVGGDFFDWYPVGDGGDLTLGDVMGKGIGAAIMMATVRAVLRVTASEPDMGRALERAAAALEPDLEQADSFVTLFRARICAVHRVLRYADAGHNLTLLVGADGRAERLASGGLPLGVVSGGHWETGEVQLQPGDTVVAFSDGLLDLLGGSLDDLGVVAGMAREATGAQDLVDRVVALADGRTLLDDVTVIALTCLPA